MFAAEQRSFAMAQITNIDVDQVVNPEGVAAYSIAM